MNGKALQPREAYWILQQAVGWSDGYDNCDQPDELQNNLEYILDKVWYE